METRTDRVEVGGMTYYRKIFITSEGTMVEILTHGSPVAAVRELTGEEAVREVERERAERVVA